MRQRRPVLVGLALALVSAAPAPDYRADARTLDRLIVENYAYPERLPEASALLDRERERVDSRRALLAYAERKLASLADHHAITGSSFDDSWAVVPSYTDIWVEKRGEDFVVDAVRDKSAAAANGVTRGDRLVAVGGVSVGNAVRAYWEDIGLRVTDDRASFAARVLAAGRRDRLRDLSFASATGVRRLTLPNLYRATPDRPPVETVATEPGARTKNAPAAIVSIRNSLGDDATIAAFDAAMSAIDPAMPIEIDLTDTPSGGNTTVARAILGWFVTRPTGYQMHNLTTEVRRTGIQRQWIEQVLPRPGKLHRGKVAVRVGRWTGSMGEGLAIGFAAIGAPVRGDGMAGLRGAVYDFTLPASGLTLKLPAERLFTVDGLPRERFVPAQDARGRPTVP